MTTGRCSSILLTLVILGCQGEQVEPETMGDYPRIGQRTRTQLKQYNQWQNYGQKVVLQPPWQLDQSKDVLSWQQPSDFFPTVHTLLVALDVSQLPALPPFILRWKLNIGIGGARQEFLIDAIGAQQLSVPMSSASVALKVEALPEIAFGPPVNDIPCLAYVAQGDAGNQLSTLTQWFALAAAGGNVGLPIPAGAVAWRLVGTGDTTELDSPFTPDVSVNLFTLQSHDEFTGDQLLETHRFSDFIPVVGGPAQLAVRNDGASLVRGAIQWSIDF